MTAEILAKEDLTPQIFGVMAAVFETPGRGQRQLADQMGVDVVSVGQTIDLLEKKHLVKRELDPDDRRARRIYVTKRGAELRSRLRPALLAAQDRLLTPLSKSERTALIRHARPGHRRQ